MGSSFNASNIDIKGSILASLTNFFNPSIEASIFSTSTFLIVFAISIILFYLQFNSRYEHEVIQVKNQIQERLLNLQKTKNLRRLFSITTGPCLLQMSGEKRHTSQETARQEEKGRPLTDNLFYSQFL